MNSSSSPPKPRAWRIALPLALLLVGAALSCWMACVGWTGKSEADMLADFIRQTESDLRKVLPAAASKNTPRAERLKVTGERAANEFYLEVHVVAVGDFNPDNSRFFASVARNQRGTPIVRVITVTTYSDATNPRTPVATYGENRTKLIQRALREKLPAAAPSDTGLPFSLSVYPNIDGLVDVYYINAAGPFTPDSAKDFVSAIGALQKTLPGETRFFGAVSSNTSRPHTILENFNTATAARK